MSDTDNTAASSLSAMKLPELRKLAADRGLKGISGLRKGELVQLLSTGSAAPAAAAKPADAAAAASSDAETGATSVRSVLGGDSPRRSARRSTRSAKPESETAGESAASVSSAAPADAAETSAADSAEAPAGGRESREGREGEGYESRSQARRARRNRARREARHEGGEGAGNNGVGASGEENADKKSIRERSLVVVDDTEAEVDATGAAAALAAVAGAQEGADSSEDNQGEGNQRRGRRRGETGGASSAHRERNGAAGSGEAGDAHAEQGDNVGENTENSGNGEHGENNDRGDRNGRGRGRGGDREGRDNDREGRQGRRGRRGRRGRDRNDREGGNDHGNNRGGDMQVREGDELQPVGGILDIVDNNVAFLRTTGYRPGSSDVFVNGNLVRRFGLRAGDAVTGQVKVGGNTHTHGNGRNRRKYNQLVQVDSVNGLEPQAAQNRPQFAKLTPLYPNQRLRLETTPNILTTRVIDLIMPIGKGQRALIVSPPKAGKTTILQNIANAIATNNPECYLMVVLVDERPEEVTDMQRSVKGEVIASTFDRPPSEHTAVAELAIERAKRLVEQGKDVVVLLDSITRLGRAYNNSSPASGRILSGGVDSNALYPPKRFLGAARNIENGGSLTIIATAMVETGSTGDTVIFEEFKGTGNAELKLDRGISERRVFPAVDVNPSGTRRDDLLLVPEEARIMTKLRRILSALDSHAAIDLLIKQLKKTKSNGEFLMQVASSAPMAADKDEEDYR